ncbi:MAG: arginase family protein, partial [Candidatus Thioglobus sp.]|nr:arginase family protein [Candidatus Thioglobus sp.]
INQVIKKIIETVKDRPAYLTFDIDGLDPAYAPGTGTPVAGGLTSAQALGIVRGLGDLKFIGADVVEVAPAYDHADITAIIAATIAHDYLVLRAKQKRSQDK